MTEYQENQEEKARLYFEYFDEIGELQEAYENQWERFADNWGVRLVQTLDEAEVVMIPTLPDTHTAIELSNAAEDSNRWIFRQGSSDWAGIMKEGWWRDRNEFSAIYRQSNAGDDIRITLYHRLEENRELAVRDRMLELQLWHGTGNGDEFIYKFKELISAKMEQNVEKVPAAAEYTGKRGNPITATYEIPIQDHDDFYGAYIAALNEGFLDLAVRNTGLVELIDKTFEESLAVYDEG